MREMSDRRTLPYRDDTDFDYVCATPMRQVGMRQSSYSLDTHCGVAYDIVDNCVNDSMRLRQSGQGWVAVIGEKDGHWP